MAIIIISGAGVSADSGLGTFRSKDGLWSQHNLDRVCNIDTWQDNYAEMHDFYNNRRIEMAAAEPNNFHKAVARWEQQYDVINITQNIDDLFERAGCKEVTHLHGFYKDMKCMACKANWQIEGAWDITNTCPGCASDRDVKPGVVFFGEDAPRYRDLDLHLHDIEAGDVVIVAGTSEQVVNVSSRIKYRHSYNIWVNPTTQPFGTYQMVIHKSAGAAAEDIDAFLRTR